MMEHSVWREEQKTNAYAEHCIRRDQRERLEGNAKNDKDLCGRDLRPGS